MAIIAQESEKTPGPLVLYIYISKIMDLSAKLYQS